MPPFGNLYDMDVYVSDHLTEDDDLLVLELHRGDRVGLEGIRRDVGRRGRVAVVREGPERAAVAERNLVELLARATRVAAEDGLAREEVGLTRSAAAAERASAW